MKRDSRRDAEARRRSGNRGNLSIEDSLRIFSRGVVAEGCRDAGELVFNRPGFGMLRE
jgi:hypothetical protein